MARALQFEAVTQKETHARSSHIEIELASIRRKKDMSEAKTHYRTIAAAMLTLLLFVAPAVAGYEEALEMLKGGKYAEAAAEFQILVDEAPEWADGYNLLGMCFARMNKLPDAERNILKAIELNGEIQHLRSNFIAGIKRLPVKVVA